MPLWFYWLGLSARTVRQCTMRSVEHVRMVHLESVRLYARLLNSLFFGFTQCNNRTSDGYTDPSFDCPYACVVIPLMFYCSEIPYAMCLDIRPRTLAGCLLIISNQGSFCTCSQEDIGTSIRSRTWQPFMIIVVFFVRVPCLLFWGPVRYRALILYFWPLVIFYLIDVCKCLHSIVFQWGLRYASANSAFSVQPSYGTTD